MTVQTFSDVLAAARTAAGGTRPGPADKTKNRYATHFANAMAVLLANALRPRFAEIKPDPSGKGVESPAQALHGLKKLDPPSSVPCMELTRFSGHLTIG